MVALGGIADMAGPAALLVPVKNDPTRTPSVHRSTHEVALDFERPANVKLATDRHVRA
jgi:hypothetical protein